MAFALIAIIALIVSVVSLSVALTVISENQHYSPFSTFTPTPTALPIINGHPNLVCYGTSVTVAGRPGNYRLIVDATMRIVGNATAKSVYLRIQTYFPNGTEAISYNMTLNVSNPDISPFYPWIYPDIGPYQTFVVQEHRDSVYVVSDSLEKTDFYATYKLTPISINS